VASSTPPTAFLLALSLSRAPGSGLHLAKVLVPLYATISLLIRNGRRYRWGCVLLLGCLMLVVMRGFVLRFGFLCGKAQEEGEGCGARGVEAVGLVVV
jgi:hypothetical protein